MRQGPSRGAPQAVHGRPSDELQSGTKITTTASSSASKRASRSLGSITSKQMHGLIDRIASSR
jgi:hypothetical protein